MFDWETGEQRNPTTTAASTSALVGYQSNTRAVAEQVFHTLVLGLTFPFLHLVFSFTQIPCGSATYLENN